MWKKGRGHEVFALCPGLGRGHLASESPEPTFGPPCHPGEHSPFFIPHSTETLCRGGGPQHPLLPHIKASPGAEFDVRTLSLTLAGEGRCLPSSLRTCSQGCLLDGALLHGAKLQSSGFGACILEFCSKWSPYTRFQDFPIRQPACLALWHGRRPRMCT